MCAANSIPYMAEGEEADAADADGNERTATSASERARASEGDDCRTRRSGEVTATRLGEQNTYNIYSLVPALQIQTTG